MTARRRARLDAVLARRQPDLTVFAENLHKTRNFSAMVRTCDAVGINEVHVYQEEQGLRTHWNTSQGAEKWLRVHPHASAADACRHLKTRGFRLVAAHLDEAAVDYRDVDYTQPVALVLGTELFGVSEATLALADTQVKIPMMGVTQKHLDVPVLKGTSGVLAFTESPARIEETACIRCGRCLEACPMYLNPSRLSLLAREERAEDLDAHHIFDCCECASCSYVCPSYIPLVQWMRLGKALVRQRKASS